MSASGDGQSESSDDSDVLSAGSRSIGHRRPIIMRSSAVRPPGISVLRVSWLPERYAAPDMGLGVRRSPWVRGRDCQTRCNWSGLKR